MSATINPDSESVERNIPVLSPNRETLIKALDQLIRPSELAVRKGTYDYLVLGKECGCTIKYKTSNDIPTESVKCKHGEYFIKYTDAEAAGV